MSNIRGIIGGVAFTLFLAAFSVIITSLMPWHIIGAGVLSLLLGMLLSPITQRYKFLQSGFGFTSKKILRLAIILMGISLSFTQVLEVGKFSLIVMVFTLITAYGGGYLFGKLLKMDWKLSGLISTGTGICGGSAIAAVAPVINAKDSDIAYAISVTFIFDILMVVLFPLMGVYFNMTDLGFGLWTGTAVNDTSSVVAAGYAFSNAAGNFAVIVKLTRTLAIVPVVLAFSFINERLNSKDKNINEASLSKKTKVNIQKIFPWFILMFLGLVAVKSTGLIPDPLSSSVSDISRFLMVMSLGAIGLRTDFSKLKKSGFAPLLHGFIISTLVVVVSFLVQTFLGQI